MRISNAEPPSALALAIEQMLAKHETFARELARRAATLEQRRPRARVRTWRETKAEILGRHE